LSEKKVASTRDSRLRNESLVHCLTSSAMTCRSLVRRTFVIEDDDNFRRTENVARCLARGRGEETLSSVPQWDEAGGGSAMYKRGRRSQESITHAPAGTLSSATEALSNRTKAARTEEAAAQPCRGKDPAVRAQLEQKAATENESICSASYSSLETQRLRVHTELNRNEQQAQTAGGRCIEGHKRS
jgi:hypothetical protein